MAWKDFKALSKETSFRRSQFVLIEMFTGFFILAEIYKNLKNLQYYDCDRLDWYFAFCGGFFVCPRTLVAQEQISLSNFLALVWLNDWMTPLQFSWAPTLIIEIKDFQKAESRHVEM